MASKNKYVYDRFISSKVINCLMRPQRADDCSISAMAVAMNVLFSMNITLDDIIKCTNWDIKKKVRNGKIGNPEIVDGLNALCKAYQLEGKADVFVSKIPKMKKEMELLWIKLKTEIKNPAEVFIYHGSGSYSVIAGYYEEASDLTAHGKTSYDFRRDWILLAENKNTSETPIRMLEWLKAREDINERRYNGIIRLRTSSDRTKQKQKVSKTKKASGVEIMPEPAFEKKSNYNPAPRLKLSRWATEDLNNKIFDEIEARIDKGFVLREAFADLSEKAEEILGNKLTAKGIEGRYNRHPEVKERRKNRY